jgi:integral membrane protein
MRNIFRIISLLEGLSYLLLLFIAVPLKYFYGHEFLVKILGMPHGILFILYIFFSIILKNKMNWNIKQTIEIMIGSIIPFGTFYIDYKYLKSSN